MKHFNDTKALRKAKGRKTKGNKNINIAIDAKEKLTKEFERKMGENTDIPLFLISNKYRDRYHFPNLMRRFEELMHAHEKKLLENEIVFTPRGDLVLHVIFFIV